MVVKSAIIDVLQLVISLRLLDSGPLVMSDLWLRKKNSKLLKNTDNAPLVCFIIVWNIIQQFDGDDAGMDCWNCLNIFLDTSIPGVEYFILGF